MPKMKIDPDGTRRWINKDGHPHRRDGPAIETPGGSRFWYWNGRLHRADGPAIEKPDGKKEWWWRGRLHRVDGPAVEWPGQLREWWRNGKIHRDDGPAVEGPGGNRKWYRRGRLHRLDGPAVELPGEMEIWYRNGEIHRSGGPAVEQADGSRYWYKRGKLHRADGPAVEKADGTKEWWIDGRKYDPLIYMMRSHGFCSEGQATESPRRTAMKFKEIDYVRYIPVVDRAVCSLLLFPPHSKTPSGFYRIEPNGVGGNKITLLRAVSVDPRTEKAWYVSCSERARLIAENAGLIAELESEGCTWSSLLSEQLVRRITEKHGDAYEDDQAVAREDGPQDSGGGCSGAPGS